MMKQGHDASRPQASRDGGQPGTIMPNRRVIGTVVRVRCGRAGEDREGDEGRERA